MCSMNASDEEKWEKKAYSQSVMFIVDRLFIQDKNKEVFDLELCPHSRHQSKSKNKGKTASLIGFVEYFSNIVKSENL